MHFFFAQVAAPFVAPALAAAGVVMMSAPIAIHLLSRWRRRPQPFGAMRFLIEAYKKQKRRMHMEQWLLLLLRCLIVLLLGLALARPLLVGWLGSLFGELDGQGRIVNIVIDDAMSLRVNENPDGTRFDRLIQSAEAMIDSLEPGDLATLWRAGRPAGILTDGPTQDRAALRQILANMQPGFTRCDLSGAISQIQQASETPEFAGTEQVTFLLSDFPRSVEYLDAVNPADADAGHPLSTFIAARPALSVSNVQITTVKPRRRTVWVGGLVDSSIPIEVRLKRYTDTLAPTEYTLNVALFDASGKQVTHTQRRVTFGQGRREVATSLDMPISAVSSWLNANGGTLLTIRAQIDDLSESLIADNQAYSAIEVRRQMRVAVVAEPGSAFGDQSQGLTPSQWMNLALDPQLAGPTGLIHVASITPSQLSAPDALQSIDAVMLLRPDRITQSTWRELVTFTQVGGLVWVFVPADEGASPWVSQLNESYQSGWRIGLEPVRSDSETAGVSLSASPLHVETLERLAADWQALAQPVRVYRYLPVQTDESDAWITLDQRDDALITTTANANGPPVLLAHRRIGLGSLLLLSTAVDTRWTNLPTKPMFVPLIHETLHGLLGTREQLAVVQGAAGDQPALGSAWAGATQLQRLQTGDDLFYFSSGNPPGTNEPALQINETGVALTGPVREPGVYLAQTNDGPRRLLINPDPQGGDTRSIDEETLTHWLDRLGNWQWLDQDHPGAALEHATTTADIGWPLLWVVLVLVLIEAMLARLFSHAGGIRSESLSAQLWQAALRWRSGRQSQRDRGGNA